MTGKTEEGPTQINHYFLLLSSHSVTPRSGSRRRKIDTLVTSVNKFKRRGVEGTYILVQLFLSWTEYLFYSIIWFVILWQTGYDSEAKRSKTDEWKKREKDESRRCTVEICPYPDYIGLGWRHEPSVVEGLFIIYSKVLILEVIPIVLFPDQGLECPLDLIFLSFSLCCKDWLRYLSLSVSLYTPYFYTRPKFVWTEA